jgi:hypothetical protein
LSGDERIRDPYLGGGEHGDEMTFGDRPLNVDSRRRSNVSNAQTVVIARRGERLKSTLSESLYLDPFIVMPREAGAPDGIVTSALFTCQTRQASVGSDEQNQ